MTAMLADLLGAIAEEIRAALPAASAAANDEDSERLLGELSSAGLLDHSDLIAALLRRADEERIANAVRARSGSKSGFLQSLIADENESVSGAAMALILARGRRRNRLGQPRIEFEDLPQLLAKWLAQSVAAAIRQHVPGLAPKDGHLPFAEAAAALLERRDQAQGIDSLTTSLIRHLKDAATLDEPLMEAAAEEGDITFVAYSLGERAGIPGSAGWDYLADGDNGRLVLLLRLAGVSREFAARLLALLGDLVGIADLGSEIARFDAMNEAQAHSVRDWLQLDLSYRAALRALGGDDGKRLD
jgi:hypothetical protein